MANEFMATDVFGQKVVATTKTWIDHVIKRHPEMAGQEHRTKDAIENPDTVIEGNRPSHKVFAGHRIQGSGFAYGGKRVVAVIEYDQARNGYLITAYTTTLDPPGKVLWIRH
jgi:hypothetical protein